MNSSNPNKWTIADVLTNFGKRQAEVQQEKMLKEQLKQALMQNQAQALGQFVPGMQQQVSPQEQEMSLDQAYQQAKAGGIHLDPAKKGTFKAQATRMKMSVQEAAAHILANKENYSPAMVKKANFARNFAKEEGGTINNPGFNALPDYVQHKILSHMAYGGESSMDEYKNGGYTVRRTDERKGKTHVVTGPDGTKKYFGDPSMGERSKSKHGKDAFYARHAQNLKNNPYFRAYAKATWADGGTFLTAGDEYHRIYKNAEGDIMVNHPKEDKGKWDTINLTDKAGANTIAQGVAATKKWHRENPEYAYGGMTDMYAMGGEMIKRADGSYSQRGLWDNIRANAGSGKKPTREMIEQERKIRKKAMGGMMGPNDCPEGYEWNDLYQTCLPINTIVPNPSETESYMNNWYQERPKIYNDPNYMSAITDPEFPNDAKKHVQLMNQVIPQMQGQFTNGTLTPIQLKDALSDPNAVGEYIPESESPNGAQVYIRKDQLQNPLNFKSTLAHEWTTHLNDPFFYDNPKYKTFYTNTITENVLPWDDFLDRAIKEGKINPKDKAAIKVLQEGYDYSTAPGEDNIHSNINVARQLFNLQPTDVITEDKVKEMMQEAEQKGYIDKNSPNYIDDIYRLYRLSKDNKSLANLFNLLADAGNKNNVLGSDIQMGKYGGNIGKLRKFF
jgi:hypothetical protein